VTTSATTSCIFMFESWDGKTQNFQSLHGSVTSSFCWRKCSNESLGIVGPPFTISDS
jgi:hypothetical protein